MTPITVSENPQLAASDQAFDFVLHCLQFAREFPGQVL